MQFGPYILDERVGRGAMAEVWSGWHAARDEHVAIKIVTRLAGQPENELDPFFHEVRTIASLSHPGIVQILDYGQAYFESSDASVPYLVTELARGGTLAEGWRPGTFGDIRRVLQAILDPLAHAHARGVIHRDLKPENVLRTTMQPDALLKVTDFGIAQLAPMGERSYADGFIAGTPKYMAPEQIRGDWRDHGPWTDLYAVGCMAWTMVTGRPPFDGNLAEVYRQHLDANLPPLVPLIGVPDALVDWLHWLLDKDLGERCARAADASMELLGLRMLDNPPTIEAMPLLEDPRTVTLTSDDIIMSSLNRPPAERVMNLRRLASANRALTDTSMHTELRLWGLRRVPFVGRRAERTELWGALQHAFESTVPQLVTLRGRPGAGKSALAQWLAERSHELGLAEPMRVVHDPISRTNDGLRGAFMRAFRLEDLDVVDAVARMRALLLDEFGDADALALAGVLGNWIVADDARTAGGFESDERASAALAVLRSQGRTRVPLIWIEDVDRAAQTLRTLVRVIELSAGTPLRLMIVATHDTESGERSVDALEYLGAHCTAQHIELPPLTIEEAQELLDAMLPLAPAFRNALIGRTQGTPLFAVQMLGALIARDELTMNDRGEFEIRDSAVPTSSFAALLDMRIASLAQELQAAPDAIREPLEIAAALGGTIRSFEWLVATQKRGAAVHRDLLDAVVRCGLAIPVGDQWAFAHDLVREELVEGAKRRGEWSRWNLLCADTLDDLYPRPDPERRASHLIEAQAWSLAADACIAAAEATLRRHADERARRWLDQAEDVFERGALAEDDLRRGAVVALRKEIRARSTDVSR